MAEKGKWCGSTHILHLFQFIGASCARFWDPRLSFQHFLKENRAAVP